MNAPMPGEQPPPSVEGWQMWFLQADDPTKEQILKDVAKRTVARFKQLRDALREQVAGRPRPRAERLLEHMQRTPEANAMFRMLLPQEYDRAIKDFYELAMAAAHDPKMQAALERLLQEEPDAAPKPPRATSTRGRLRTTPGVAA